MKQFHFSTGLPRSGSTLLTSLFNQNPNIHASHGSDIPKVFEALDGLFPQLDSVQQKLSLEGYDSILTNLYPTFFSFAKQQIIIDKLNRSANLSKTITCLEIANPNYKVIVTVRPILEILASFVSLCQQNPTINIYDKLMLDSEFSVLSYRNIDDSRCDYIMSENGPIQKTLSWLHYAKQNPHNFMFVKYEDLTNNTQQIMDEIYAFIDTPSHKHNLCEIPTLNMKQGDFELYGMPTLHEVRSTISKSTTDINLLSDYTKNKYSGTLDFLNLYV